MTDWAKREERRELGFYKKRGLCLVRGEGARVYDSQGNEYVDCIAGHGVASIGHNNRYVKEALTEQMNQIITCPESFANDTRTQYLDDLAQVTPEGLDRFYLCNSGTEAVEAALKIAVATTGRTRIISTMRGFHGRTMGALTTTWSCTYRREFAPPFPEVLFVPHGDTEALEDVLDEDTAAVILEGIQGEGGIHVASEEYLRAVHGLCERNGALFIADEIQTGFGRTGKWFFSDHAGVVPDLMCTAKAMAGGLPMGAVAGGRRIGNLPSGLHGSTFGGNPLACAAASAALGYMRSRDLPARAREMGDWFINQLREIEHPQIRDIRGRGLMVGVDMRGRVTPYLKKLQERGILALPAGRTVLRFLPPLTITEAELAQVVQTLKDILGEA